MCGQGFSDMDWSFAETGPQGFSLLLDTPREPPESSDLPGSLGALMGYPRGTPGCCPPNVPTPVRTREPFRCQLPTPSLAPSASCPTLLPSEPLPRMGCFLSCLCSPAHSFSLQRGVGTEPEPGRHAGFLGDQKHRGKAQCSPGIPPNGPPAPVVTRVVACLRDR